jgi:hypothetical protein
MPPVAILPNEDYLTLPDFKFTLPNCKVHIANFFYFAKSTFTSSPSPCCPIVKSTSVLLLGKKISQIGDRPKEDVNKVMIQPRNI